MMHYGESGHTRSKNNKLPIRLGQVEAAELTED